MDKKKVFLYMSAGLWTLCVVLLAVSAIHIYLTGAAYQADGHPEAWIFTRERAAGALWLAAPAFVLAVFSSVMYRIVERQNTTQKRFSKQEKTINQSNQQNKNKEKQTGNKHKFNILWICLVAVSVFFIISGAINGSMLDVLIKAINLCTECIGLG